ncbi:MAG: hypothetical protein P8019_06140 [Gammaproteobacteria bacterium]|jgi:hypothetical protein
MEVRKRTAGSTAADQVVQLQQALEQKETAYAEPDKKYLAIGAVYQKIYYAKIRKNQA